MKDNLKYASHVLTIAVMCVSLIACTQAQVDAVLSDADLVLQTANSLSTAIGAVSPGDAAALNLLTGVAITGINAVKTAYDTYEANKTASNLQNVVVAAQAIQTNLPAELAALHIVDTNAIAKATAWVNLVVSVAEAIVSAVGGVTAAHAANLAIPTPEFLQVRWLNEVCAGDTACGSLVKVHHKHLPRKW